MSLFDSGKRIPPEALGLDVEGLRRGFYTDKYFLNIARLLEALSQRDYRYAGQFPRPNVPKPQEVAVGDIEVEMQWFPRREPFTVVSGIDHALAILKTCAGEWDESGQFINRFEELEVLAVQEGSIAPCEGNLLEIVPVLKVRGKYRYFGYLETATLGVLTRASRIATQTYRILVASGGTPVSFFPARFDSYTVQAMDGYAYWIGVQRYNHDFQANVHPYVSTDAQASLWGGAGSGTTAHAVIACFLGDTAEMMLRFAEIVPPKFPRIALVDFNNNCVEESKKVLRAMFFEYKKAYERGDEAGMKRYTLFGVRADTAGDLRDESLAHLPDSPDLYGVSPALIRAMRAGIDNAWQDWNLNPEWQERAADYCRSVKIVASGGFSIEKLERFAAEKVPVDLYGIGSHFFQNCSHCGTSNDYTADVVRVKVHDEWIDLAKVGRRSCENVELERVL